MHTRVKNISIRLFIRSKALRCSYIIILCSLFVSISLNSITLWSEPVSDDEVRSYFDHAVTRLIPGVIDRYKDAIVLIASDSNNPTDQMLQMHRLYLDFKEVQETVEDIAILEGVDEQHVKCALHALHRIDYSKRFIQVLCEKKRFPIPH